MSVVVEIIIHNASNVPAADIHNLSADPYITASFITPSLHQPREVPGLHWRTPTVHRTRDPVWDNKWIVGGVAQDGFILKLGLVDEDPKDHDDRLGVAEVLFTKDMMRDGFHFEEREFKFMKRRGSIVPYVLTYVEGLLPHHQVRKHNRVVLSAHVIRTTSAKNSSRAYTIGPNAYSLHFSPLLGSVINHGDRNVIRQPLQPTGDETKYASASSFVACKLQLAGPVPAELYHRFVGYNWFIKMLYARRGLSGRLLFQGLRKQYRTIYSHDKGTLYGVVQCKDGCDLAKTGSTDHTEEHSRAFAKQFLEMTNYGRGGRLQTYVMTLDGQWRFCETGDEFAIDFLSKHMMHADGDQIVAYAGEFFVRRVKQGTGESGQATADSTKAAGSDDEDDNDPAHYELVIDNDSGTYRPPESTLPILQSWLADKKRLGALARVTTMHCFDDGLQALKKQRKEIKMNLAGGQISKRRQVKRSGSSASSTRINGKKLSRDEVERVVGEQQIENERKLHNDSSITSQ